MTSARILTSRNRMPDGMRQGEAALSCIQGCALKVAVVVENIATFEPTFLSYEGYMTLHNDVSGRILLVPANRTQHL